MSIRTIDPKRQKFEFSPIPPGIQYKTVFDLDSSSSHDGSSGEDGMAWYLVLFSTLLRQEIQYDFLDFLFKSNNITLEDLFYKSVETQPPIAVLASFGVVLGGIYPLAGFFICLTRLCRSDGRREENRSRKYCFYLERNILRIILVLLLMFLTSSLVVVIASNETLRTSTNQIAENFENGVADLATFFRNSEEQYKFLFEDSVDRATGAIYMDLDDIDYLLGRELQKDLVKEVQIETVVEALQDISEDLSLLSSRIKALDSAREQAITRELEVSYRLKLLKDELLSIISRCSSEDRDLCMSLNVTGLELTVSFQNLSFSKYLSQVSESEVQILSETSRKVRYEFDRIPSLITSLTEEARREVKLVLKNFQSSLDLQMKNLDLMTLGLETKKGQLLSAINSVLAPLIEWQNPRWFLGIGTSVCLGVIVTMLLTSECLGCCFYKESDTPDKESCHTVVAAKLIIISLVLIFLLSSVLWALCSSVFYIGLHVHELSCRPLHEKPDYRRLSALFDTKGIFYPEEGFWSYFLSREPQIPLGNVLNKCEYEKTAYEVFRIDELFNINSHLNLESSTEFNTALEKININSTHFEFISPEMERRIQDFLQNIELDVTPIRQFMEQNLTRQNISTFTKQIDGVASKIRSSSISAQFFRLSPRYRALAFNALYPLQRRKEDLTYQLASLDREIPELQTKIQATSSELRKMQNYINTKGTILILEKVKRYRKRLSSHGERLFVHVKEKVLKELSKCSPIWGLFRFIREFICNGIVQPLNKFWMALLVTLLLYIPTIIITLRLSNYYRAVLEDEELVITDEDEEKINSMPYTSSIVSDNLWVTSGIHRFPFHYSFDDQQEDVQSHHEGHPSHRRDSQRYSNESFRIRFEGSQPYEGTVGYDKAFPKDHNRCAHHIHPSSHLLLPHVINKQPVCSLPPKHNVHSKQQILSVMPLTVQASPRRPSFEVETQQTEPSTTLSKSKHVALVHQKQQKRNKKWKKNKTMEVVKASEIERQQIHTNNVLEEYSEWNGTSSDVVAAAQVSAWRDAARAGANFITPEVVAVHVRKTPSWVKKFWHTDPKLLAKNLLRSAPAPHPQPNTHTLRLLCGARVPVE